MIRKAFMVVFFASLITLTVSCSTSTQAPPRTHPQSGNWQPLFESDLSDAVCPEGVWTFEDGILTASEDHNIWAEKEYDNFILDLEFKNDHETNSGVIVYCRDINNWIPNSIEVQIADDYSEKWSNVAPSWQCGAIFGHLPASKRMVKQPGQWNRFTITCIDHMIYVLLNGESIIEMDMNRWTSAAVNPDGSEIPNWLTTPFAELPTRGRIGLQGKHGNATIYFRNIRIKEIE
jgi:hypothetical protein